MTFFGTKVLKTGEILPGMKARDGIRIKRWNCGRGRLGGNMGIIPSGSGTLKGTFMAIAHIPTDGNVMECFGWEGT